MRTRRYTPRFNDPMQSGLNALSLLILTRAHFVCDSGGNLPLDPYWLRSQLMPLADIRPSDITSATASLIRAGVWITYESLGRKYAHIVGFIEDGGQKRFEHPAHVAETRDEARLNAPASQEVAEKSQKVAESRDFPRRDTEFHGGNGTGGAASAGGVLARAKVSEQGLRKREKVSVLGNTEGGDLGVTETSETTRAREVAALVTAIQAPLRTFVPRLDVALCARQMEKHLRERCGRFLHYDEMQAAALLPTLARWLDVKKKYIAAAADGTREIYVAKFFPAWLDEHAEDVKEGTLWKRLKTPKPNRQNTFQRGG